MASVTKWAVGHSCYTSQLSSQGPTKQERSLALLFLKVNTKIKFPRQLLLAAWGALGVGISKHNSVVNSKVKVHLTMLTSWKSENVSFSEYLYYVNMYFSTHIKYLVFYNTVSIRKSQLESLFPRILLVNYYYSIISASYKLWTRSPVTTKISLPGIKSTSQ